MNRHRLDFPRTASGVIGDPAVAARIVAGPCVRGMAADFSTQVAWSRMRREGRADDLLAHLNEVEDDRLARF